MKYKEFYSYLFEGDDYLETSWQFDKGSPIIKIKDLIGLLDILRVKPTNIPLKKLENIIVKQDYNGKQKERLSSANLEFPILVAKKGGKYVMIIDGNHRATKSLRSGNTHILARELDLDDNRVPEQYKKLFSNEI